MKRRSLVIISAILVVAVTLYFIHENHEFNHYISSRTNGEMNIRINQSAPVLARAEITVNAPVETVWEVLTAIDEWPEWQKEVTAAKLNGELREGVTFDWTAGGLNFESGIHTIQIYKAFGWTGTTFGASAIHNWIFMEENTTTTIKVEESLQGVFPRLFRSYFQESLEEGILNNLMEIKIAAESHISNK